MKRPFVKIKLHSDVGGAALGQKDIVIYFECAPNTKNVRESNILSYDDALLAWVNTDDRFQKGDLGKDFEFYRQPFEFILLNDKEIKIVQDAGHLVRESDLEKMY